MDLRNYLIALRRGWWLIVAAVIVGSAVAAVLAFKATPVYASSVKFYISTPVANNANALSTDQFAQDRAYSYALLLSSDKLGDLIAADSQPKLPLTGHQIASTISGSAQLNTVVVKAVVHDSSPQRAYQIARAVSAEFPEMVSQLENPPGSKTAVSLSVTSEPRLPTEPISPRKKVMLVLGALVGLILGLILAMLRHVLDTSVRGQEDLEEIVGAPTLATVPLEGGATDRPLVSGSSTWSARGEAIRRLRTSLQFVEAAHGVQVVVVTSAVSGEGKSTTATNLALVMAESGRRTLLLEADLRHPKVGEYLDIEHAVGLSNVLASQVNLDDALQTWGPDELSVLPSGSLPPNPSELLSSAVMLELLGVLRQRFDFIIIDSPPLLPVTDAAILAAESDGVIVVFRHRKTRRSQLIAAIHSLRSVDARILGSVLNMKRVRRADKRGYGAYGRYATADRSSGVDLIRSQEEPVPDPRRAHNETAGEGTSPATAPGDGIGRRRGEPRERSERR